MARTAEIVGAGFAGLVAATALAQRGWQVRLHERAAELRAFGAGIFIWENGLRVLQQVGAYEDTVNGSHEAPVYWVRDRNNQVVGKEVFGPEQGTRMFTLTRQKLYAALLGAARRAGVATRVNSHVVSATPDGAIRTEDGHTFKADLVVGADGVNSRVRDSLGLLKSRTTEAWGAIRLLIPRLPGDGDEICTYQSAGERRTLYVPCDAENLYLCFTLPADDLTGQKLPFDVDMWGHDFPHLRPLYDRIGSEGRWDLYETIELHAWTKGSVAMIGDAAHGMTPALGQGAGCAMMNGLSLATYVDGQVDGKSDIPAALRAWEQGERPLTDHTQRYAQSLTRGENLSAAASGTKWTDDALRTARHVPLGPGSRSASAAPA